MLVAAFISPPPSSSSLISILNSSSTLMIISTTSNSSAGFFNFDSGAFMSISFGSKAKVFATIFLILTVVSLLSLDDGGAVGLVTSAGDGVGAELRAEEV